jgi:hypothetical protein
VPHKKVKLPPRQDPDGYVEPERPLRWVPSRY